MSYRWFVFIMLASTAATILLAAWKTMFVNRLSWFAVPWPLFIGITILGWRYIYTVILWQQ